LWTLECPSDGEETDFELRVHSEYTAEPYTISLKLGHYSRKFQGVRKPVGAPMINEEAVAEIQVVSAYTAQELEGVEVQWCVDGKLIDTIKTSSSGWTRFKYTFLEARDYLITATVDNPYSGVSTVHEFPVRVFADSPWKDATLTVNSELMSWRSPVVLLRGSANEIAVQVSPIIASQLKLQLVDGDGVIIAVEPRADEWQLPVDDQFKWTLTPEQAKSGRVTLKFESEDVGRGWEHDCRVVSGNLADELEVVIDDKPSSSDGNFFIRDVTRQVKLTLGKDSPIAGLPMVLEREIESGLVDADLTSSPGFGVSNPDHLWNFTGSNNSGTFKLSIKCHGIPTPMILALNTLLSADLNDEADVHIEGAAIPAKGQLFFRGEAQTLTVVAKPGSPLGRFPVALQWAGGTLTADDVICMPDFNDFTDRHSWEIRGPTAKSGTFQFKLVANGMATPITPPSNTLISLDLNDEVDVKIGNVAVPEGGALFMRGKSRAVTLTPKSGSPIAGLGLRLRYASGGSLPESDLNSSPDFEVTTTQHTWDITGPENHSGTFAVEVVCEQLAKLAIINNTVLSANIQDEMSAITISHNGGPDTPVDLEVDGLVMTSDSARLTFTPSVGSPVKGREVALKWGAGSNSSIIISPERFAFGESGVVGFEAFQHADSNKLHTLHIDYGGAITEGCNFRYFTGPPLASFKILCDGRDQGAFPVVMRFDKTYTLAIVPKAPDSVFIGWKCKFLPLSQPGIDVELLPPSDDWVNIEAPLSGGAQRGVRARSTGGFDNRRIYLEVILKNIDGLRIPIEVDDL
jgi:hypothetical protein